MAGLEVFHELIAVAQLPQPAGMRHAGLGVALVFTRKGPMGREVHDPVVRHGEYAVSVLVLEQGQDRIAAKGFIAHQDVPGLEVFQQGRHIGQIPAPRRGRQNLHQQTILGVEQARGGNAHHGALSRSRA